MRKDEKWYNIKKVIAQYNDNPHMIEVISKLNMLLLGGETHITKTVLGNTIAKYKGSLNEK